MCNIRRRITGQLVTVIGFVILQVVCVPASTLPPDPDNAALLYYQAMMACPEPNDTMEDMVHNVLGGSDPCRRTIGTLHN